MDAQANAITRRERVGSIFLSGTAGILEQLAALTEGRKN